MKPVTLMLTSGLALLLLAQVQPSAPPAAKTSVAIYPIKAVGAVDKSLAATVFHGCLLSLIYTY